MQTKTVVVAEDDADLRQLLIRVVGRVGCKVIEAENGPAALAAARRGADAVVLDLCLPGLSGLQVCRKLRSEHRRRKMPIIMFSAVAGDDARFTAMAAGADAYLIKPFSMIEMTELVLKALDPDPTTSLSPGRTADLAGRAVLGHHRALDAYLHPTCEASA